MAKYSISSCSTAVSRQNVPSTVRSSLSRSPGSASTLSAWPKWKAHWNASTCSSVSTPMPTRRASSVTVSSSRSSRSRATAQRPVLERARPRVQRRGPCASCARVDQGLHGLACRSCARRAADRTRASPGRAPPRRPAASARARTPRGPRRRRSARSSERSSTSSSTASRPPTVSPNTPTASASSASTSEASVPTDVEDVDVHRLGLADAIEAADALLHRRRAPRQVVVHQVVRELEVAALAADLGAEEQLRAVRVAEAGHLPVALHQRRDRRGSPAPRCPSAETSVR